MFNFLSEDARAKIEATKKAMIERKKQSERSPKGVPEEIDESGLDSHENTPVQEANTRALGTVDVTALRPFARDPNKQDRFERFIAFAEKGHRGL